MKPFSRIVFVASALPVVVLGLANCTTTSGGSTTEAKSDGGSTTTDGGGGGGGSLTGNSSPAAIAQGYFDAFVRQAERCQGGPAASVLDAFFVVDDVADQISAPGITVEMKQKLVACIDSLKSAPCGGTTPECFASDALMGTLAAGQPCGFEVQCATAKCSATETACGTCFAGTIAAGGDCSGAKEDQCLTGLKCVQTGANTASCATRTLAAEGGACGNAAQECGVGLACDYRAGGAPTCKKLLAAGATCADAQGITTGECDNGGMYYCDATTTKTCVKRPTAGETCAQPSDCSSGLVCDAGTKKCRAHRTDVAINSPCAFGDRCVAGASCSGFDPIAKSALCTATLAENADCSGEEAQCGAGLVCSSAKKCVKKIAASSCK